MENKIQTKFICFCVFFFFERKKNLIRAIYLVFVVDCKSYGSFTDCFACSVVRFVSFLGFQTLRFSI